MQKNITACFELQNGSENRVTDKYIDSMAWILYYCTKYTVQT